MRRVGQALGQYRAQHGCRSRLARSQTTGQGDFDPRALAERYRREREKRLNREATEEYLEVGGELAEDPYIDAPLVRDAIVEEVDVAVVGGGFGGLLAAGRLREAGVETIRVIEKAGDFGGTWYWNRYPGAACDIEAYIYMPLLDELGYVPSEKYARAPEIFDHSKRIAEHFGLYERALLQTEVTGMTWDGDASRWIVTTNRGDRIAARFVVTASGPLHKPKLPAIDGVESFAGHSFHAIGRPRGTEDERPGLGNPSVRLYSLSNRLRAPPLSSILSMIA